MDLKLQDCQTAPRKVDLRRFWSRFYRFIYLFIATLVLELGGFDLIECGQMAFPVDHVLTCNVQDLCPELLFSCAGIPGYLTVI